MERIYCTFWYPIVYYRGLSIDYRSKEIIKDIADNSELYNIIEIIHAKNGDLIINNRTRYSSFSVVLHCIDNNRNDGFVQYFFEKGAIPQEQLEVFKIILKKDIYRMAMECYSSYNTDINKDIALHAIITTKKIDLDESNNEALIHFLNCFANIFIHYVENISHINSVVQAYEIQIKEIGYKKISKKDREVLEERQKKVLGQAYVINELCDKALKEYIFYQTLSYSTYNKSFSTATEVDIIDPDKEQKNYLRYNAVNIRNSIEYINFIKYKNQDRLHLLTQSLISEVKEAGKNSHRVTIMGTVLGIISLGLGVLSIYLANKSNSDFPKTESEYINDKPTTSSEYNDSIMYDSKAFDIHKD